MRSDPAVLQRTMYGMGIGKSRVTRSCTLYIYTKVISSVVRCRYGTFGPGIDRVVSVKVIVSSVLLA